MEEMIQHFFGEPRRIAATLFVAALVLGIININSLVGFFKRLIGRALNKK